MAVVALLSLAFVVVRSPVGWPDSGISPWGWSAAWRVLSLAMIVVAGGLITAGRIETVIIAFGAALAISGVGLLLLNGSLIVVTMFVGLLGLGCIAYRSAVGGVIRAQWRGDNGEICERGLACAAAAVVSMALVSAIHVALTVESRVTVDVEEGYMAGSRRRSALPRRSAIEAARDREPAGLSRSNGESTLNGAATALIHVHSAAAGLAAIGVAAGLFISWKIGLRHITASE